MLKKRFLEFFKGLGVVRRQKKDIFTYFFKSVKKYFYSSSYGHFREALFLKEPK